MKEKSKHADLPKITVIVPIYNVEPYLERCVNSILNQSYQNLEIILVDDGSPDNCGAICDEFAKKDDRIVVIHQKNKGLSGARNTGLENATGDYIGFVDSDDWIDEEMYGEMMDAMLQNDVNLVECDFIFRTEYGEKEPEEGTLEHQTKLQALQRILRRRQFSVCKRLYEKSLLDGLKFPEGKISEDVYFTSYVFKRVDKIVYLSNHFYNYYRASESITRGPYNPKNLKQSIEAAFFLRENIGSVQEDPELQRLANTFLMDILLYNYKLLHHNHDQDANFELRIWVRKLFKDINGSLPLQHAMAKLLPVRLYYGLIRTYTGLKSILSKKNQA